jgi:hypothetical protein
VSGFLPPPLQEYQSTGHRPNPTFSSRPLEPPVSCGLGNRFREIRIRRIVALPLFRSSGQFLPLLGRPEKRDPSV